MLSLGRTMLWLSRNLETEPQLDLDFCSTATATPLLFPQRLLLTATPLRLGPWSNTHKYGSSD